MGRTRTGALRQLQTKSIERQERVAKLYVEGKNQYEIAKLEKVTQSCISGDIRRIRQRWLDRANEAFDQKKADELAKIDNLEVLALDAWKRSCEDAEINVKKVKKALRKVKGIEANIIKGKKTKLPEEEQMELTPVVDEETKTRKGQSGNPAFLEVIRGCIEMRAKILGLFQEIHITNQTEVNIINQWNAIITGVTQNGAAPTSDPVEDRIKTIEAQRLQLPNKEQ